MHDPERIIAYRNRTEQLQDEFWYDIAAPWLYEHWYIVVGVIIALFVWYKLANRRNRW